MSRWAKLSIEKRKEYAETQKTNLQLRMCDPEFAANRKAKQTEWVQNNRQKCREAERRYRSTEKGGKTRLDSSRLRRYGFNNVDELLKSQNYVCPICGIEITYRSPLDHSHTTGMIRGVLCDNCNKALGLLRDSIPSLQSAITYLQKYND